ncbi:MAG: EAL domain-containing protein [Anaerostipes sp.]|nr:EAL domain-containing protein [Anaerostipes sp.]
MRKSTVLVVEDQMINRKVLGKILSDTYNVLYASDGEECMEVLYGHAPEISAILLDIVMPKIDGFAVLKKVQNDSVLSKIPIIVSSGIDKEESEVRALKLGAQDFISKPYKADIIIHRLNNLIRLRESAALINTMEKDELTGLYNKQFFLKKVRAVLDENPNGAYDIICIDIDCFKLINDTFGMAVGDKLLVHIANFLRELDKGRYICSHFGADVFYMLVSRKMAYSNGLFEEWNKIINRFSIQIQIKAKFGIYQINNTELSVNGMCDRASLAIENVKRQYNELYSIYDDVIRQKMLNERMITDSMQEALDTNQFHVYYQPKYELVSETVAGAEALVRWIHPSLGFMNPGEFIPLFEKNGFIIKLDQYVWEKTCQDIRERIDSGLKPVAISVNVSRTDIFGMNIVDVLTSLVQKYEIPISYLHLEITETVYTDDPEKIIEVVKELRSLGFIIEMDDFGSGYSSLNMLAEIPIDILKLDMRFIKSESENASGKGILSFIISLAKWLDLAVIAEGVETKEQIASLKTMDCNYVQGYYYAKPMPKKDFISLMEKTPLTDMKSTSSTRKNLLELQSRKERKNGREMLIVDDIEVNRTVLAAIFEDEYDIVEKENGKEALDYLGHNFEKVDIVMLDLLMPVMDGFQCLEHIRTSEMTKNLPVIITSQGETDGEVRALEMGADDFISKPYNEEIIKHRVHNVMGNYKMKRFEVDKEIMKKIESSGSLLPLNSKLTKKEDVYHEIEWLRNYFDIVRLVNPENVHVFFNPDDDMCENNGCFSVWGKQERCNNCISLRALEDKTRYNKLEYSNAGLFFVISQYKQVEGKDYVVEMVTKLDDSYVDNIFQRDLLYVKLDLLNQQLETDELTGVYNRRHIHLHLDKYISQARKNRINLGVAMVDMDGLKEINDRYGHLTGDLIIKRTANILKNNFASSKGDFVARFGGDEFLVVCRGIEQEVFQKRMKEVRDLVKKEHMRSQETGEPVSMGISAGCVSLYEFPNADANDLIKIADERLYQAKHLGRNQVVFKS